MVKGIGFENIIFAGKYRWLRHLLFWVIYFLVFAGDFGFDMNDYKTSVETTLVFTPANFIYVYGVVYWLVPKYLIKGKYLAFCLMFFVWMVAGLMMNYLTRYYILLPLRGVRPDYSFNLSETETYRKVFAFGSFVVMITIAMIGGFLKFFKYWYAEQQQKQQAEKEKVSAELQLLKAQLHPHFLFNTLNNLYSLVNEKSDRAPKMLMRLSGLLSYILYECKADEVSLSKEVSIIKDYVSLEKERYGDRLDISLNFSGDIEGRMIVPILFQPFIENAFKHGTAEQLGKVWISIDLSVKKNQLYFKIINSCDKNPIAASEKGIGIDNVRKRLSLLYPGQFELQNGMEGDVYIVSLTLDLGGPETKEPVVKNIPVSKIIK
ncbi:MAG TPA: histidine kinase [Chitinophagaceae bacterium]|nr:histidine kinase [Chitinophagaceae bacterium]